MVKAMNMIKTTTKVDREVLKKICEMKSHPRQSNNEILRKVLGLDGKKK